MSITLRAAKPQDAALLSSLAIRAKAHWAYSADFMASVEAELTVSSAQLANSDWLCQVAICRGDIVGYALLDTKIPVRWILDAMFVEPKMMGHGVGRRLMAWVKTSMQQKQCLELLIASDPNAESFYLRMGAERIGETPSDSIAGRVLPLLRIRTQQMPLNK